MNTEKRTEPNAIEIIGQRFFINACGLTILLGALIYLGAMNYTDIEEVDRPEQVMDTRPDAPGTEDVVWEKHQDKCWLYEPKGQTTGALVRVRPNDPFIYTRKPSLVKRALDQAVDGKPRGLDRVLAFCTDKITEKGH